jgi:hypothetical protein
MPLLHTRTQYVLESEQEAYLSIEQMPDRIYIHHRYQGANKRESSYEFGLSPIEALNLAQTLVEFATARVIGDPKIAKGKGDPQ